MGEVRWRRDREARRLRWGGKGAAMGEATGFEVGRGGGGPAVEK
jgi:hypothetical protein